MKMRNKFVITVYLLALISVSLELSRLIIFLLSESILAVLFLVESLLISATAIIIRFFIIDVQKFSAVIYETNITKSIEKKLNPIRFLNTMPIAMIFCTIADFLLRISFIIGMLAFIAAQLLYIRAYSGIIHLNVNLLYKGELKQLAYSSTIIISLLVFILYFTLIYTPEDTLSLLVIPYIIIIIIMVLITFFNLGYKSRTQKFRISLCIGATLFLISDAILAINLFKFSIPMATFWIIGTYLPAIILLQFAILFLQTSDGLHIFKET